MHTALALLAAAIGSEVAASALLPRADGFKDPWWTAVVLLGYGLSIWLLALVVRTLSVSVTYAIWAGVGTAVVAVVGVFFLGEAMSWAKGVSLALIIAGVIGLNLVGGAKSVA
ncbi:QacE family quaternary ammonium compound efflux SMR transporter [Frankia sp. CNm7]|uniref:QacE family quaternary ammonium compound efflux SMR transporter n=1 Tax=Frankia nepalensis TaxID=1836974 RepID=A0A937UQD7_9ACTN|nr:SMR family transporter [Frankia nepalensis]MBL7495792.1 QacE family quaternary ammonium compound efflux SMR transporter [Frankia nepalensis]MBL7513274.1 QacE family quaternary ammonium compound efflux SMR transporter [Frankia nepalensis]MBL7523774.1 QacE family quaternary ammonium compound efflux SMR transporter [Frankia nepalensis]MBL7628155.1 QacE family quaternary ammonium compound efflux SMR transporter [Frankia nepalensis]